MVNVDVFAEGNWHLDWHGPGLVDIADADLASGLVYNVFDVENYGVNDAVQKISYDLVSVMAGVLGGALILGRGFDSLMQCAVCGNQAAPEATFRALEERHHLRQIACLL